MKAIKTLALAIVLGTTLVASSQAINRARDARGRFVRVEAAVDPVAAVVASAQPGYAEVAQAVVREYAVWLAQQAAHGVVVGVDAASVAWYALVKRVRG